MDLKNNNTAFLDEEIFSNETKSLWVFAYGSLCWKPEFQFSKAVKGYIPGFKREFWQGNTAHRGTKQNPGRVATLIESKKVDSKVYGIALQINDKDAIPYLSRRECELGGYKSYFKIFYPINGKPFNVLLYIANFNNPFWLGDAKIEDIADQIANCRGPSGHNIEYVIRLANFMNEHFPEHDDYDLSNLKETILNIIKVKGLTLDEFMGNNNGCITFIQKISTSNSSIVEQEELQRTVLFQEATLNVEKSLRCIKI